MIFYPPLQVGSSRYKLETFQSKPSGPLCDHAVSYFTLFFREAMILVTVKQLLTGNSARLQVGLVTRYKLVKNTLQVGFLLCKVMQRFWFSCGASGASIRSYSAHHEAPAHGQGLLVEILDFFALRFLKSVVREISAKFSGFSEINSTSIGFWWETNDSMPFARRNQTCNAKESNL